MAFPTPFDVKATERDDLTTVGVTGELDCDTAPRLNQVLASLADPGRLILVDLSQTEFMDCASNGRRLQAPASPRRRPCPRLTGTSGVQGHRLTQLDKLINVVGRTAPSASRCLGDRWAERP